MIILTMYVGVLSRILQHQCFILQAVGYQLGVFICIHGEEMYSNFNFRKELAKHWLVGEGNSDELTR